jgi:hypothetical protein
MAPSSFIEAEPTVGRKFRAEVGFGPGVTGLLRITMVSTGLADERQAGDALVTLQLNLNPTLTRMMAVRRNAEPAEGLDLTRFFKARATTDEAFGEGSFASVTERALDKSENVLLTLAELGGQTVEQRRAARDGFLDCYERKLRLLVDSIFDHQVEVDWASVLLEQAEIYFERRTTDPVTTVRRLSDRGLQLARRVKAQRFADAAPGTTYALEQSDGFPHLIVPLTGQRSIELSIYAKTDQRVRFEVRFKRAFAGVLRGQSTGEDRLAALLKRLTHDAEKRLPWKALKGAASEPPDADIGDIAELIHRLVDASRIKPELFGPLIGQLMLSGGVIADDERHPGIEQCVRRLVRQGVLERWTIQLKEERSSRRFGLTPRFAEVRRLMLSGFLPRESVPTFGDIETILPDDHYEESTRIAGGRHMVQRPLRAR